jgi:hypothetical protein
MTTIRIFGLEWLAERWDPKARLLDTSRWQFGAERLTGASSGWQAWAGPFAFAVCRAPRRKAVTG